MNTKEDIRSQYDYFIENKDGIILAIKEGIERCRESLDVYGIPCSVYMNRKKPVVVVSDKPKNRTTWNLIYSARLHFGEKKYSWPDEKALSDPCDAARQIYEFHLKLWFEKGNNA